MEVGNRVFHADPAAGAAAPLARSAPRPAGRSPLPEVLLVAGDLLSALLAFGLVLALGDALLARAAGLPADPLARFLAEAPRTGLLVSLAIVLFAFAGLYARALWEAEEIRRIALGALLLALFDLGLRLLPGGAGPGLWTLAAWPAFALLVPLVRALLRSLPVMRRALAAHLVLLGRAVDAEAFLARLRANPWSPVVLLHAGPLAAGGEGALAGLVARAARRAGIRPERVEVVLAPDAEEEGAARAAAAELARLGQPFAVALALDAQGGRGFRIRRVTGLDLVLAGEAGSGMPWLERAAKRLLDITVAGLALLLLAPFLAVIALLIRRDGGPVLYGQLRVGRNDSRFRCLKFRSMHPDADRRLAEILACDPAARAEWDRHQKLSRDPRVTPVGRFLRQTSLDELPQLVNVLRGEMSLVGPRPIVAPEIPGYDGDRAYYASPAFAAYAACTPGITGLWQVSGRAFTSHEERVRLDAWYARNWSFWLDIAILFRTLRALLGRTGR